MKKTLILILVLFLGFNASAYTLGTMTYDTTKKATGNTSFKIGFVNLGDEKIQVGLSSSDFRHGEIILPSQQIEVEPSEVSKNPQGSGWMHLDNGKYAKIQKHRFWVLTGRATGKKKFNIRIEGQRNRDRSQVLNPRMIQVRDYQFQLDFSGTQRRRKFKNSDEGPVIVRKNRKEDKKESEKNKENRTVSDDYRGQNDKNQSTNSSEESRIDGEATSAGTNGLTLILMLGTMGSLLYLWRVI